MNDMISRQSAIDAIDSIGSLDTDADREYARGIFNALPSAQSEIIRCKECRHRIVNQYYVERGHFNIKAYCELDTGDPFELGRYAEKDEWFCADAERRIDECYNQLRRG